MFKFEVFAGHPGSLTRMIICEHVGFVRAWTTQQAYAKAAIRFPGYYGMIVRRKGLL